MTAPAFAASVIIPHYNDSVRLRLCLESLLGQPHADDVEIIVADNNSSEDFSQLRADFPQVRFVVETARGAAAARNRGVAESRAAWLFLIDSDCIADANWLAQALSHQDPNIVVGGRVDVFDETPPPRNGAEAFETVFAFRQKLYIERDGFTGTGNMVVARDAFEKVGPFHDGVSEDIDWSWRAREKGYRIIYDDALVVRHPTRADFSALARKTRRTEIERFLLNGQSFPDRLRWILRAGAVAGSVAVHGPRLLADKRLTSMTERLGGLWALLRIRTLRAGWMVRQALFGVMKH